MEKIITTSAIVMGTSGPKEGRYVLQVGVGKDAYVEGESYTREFHLTVEHILPMGLERLSIGAEIEVKSEGVLCSGAKVIKIWTINKDPIYETFSKP